MIKDEVRALCADALVCRRGDEYLVLLPEKTYNEERNKFEKLFSEKGEKVTFDKRQSAEVYTRVMGYLRRVEDFNIGKKSEHYDRKPFSAEITQKRLL